MRQIEAQLARELAEQVRLACLEQAIDAYEEGGMSGLCAEGRWELVLDTLRSMQVGRVVNEWLHNAGLDSQ